MEELNVEKPTYRLGLFVPANDVRLIDGGHRTFVCLPGGGMDAFVASAHRVYLFAVERARTGDEAAAKMLNDDKVVVFDADGCQVWPVAE